jgi:2-haloacid dehalogenase
MQHKRENLTTIVFDLGGVLIDWNPRYLYREIFDDEEAMELFLSKICTSEWNEKQDAGRSLQEGTQILLDQHPLWEREIRAFYGQWEKMLNGPIEATVKILDFLATQTSYRLYALTNWSAETWPIALAQYPFLQRFKGILVSGKEGLAKPDPVIYRLLFERFQINPAEALFIDDNLRNIEASIQSGMEAKHFTTAEDLKTWMEEQKIVSKALL